MFRTIKSKSYTHDGEYYYRLVRKNMRKLRKEQGLTQQDLAEMTDISREYICDIENESRNKHPRVDTLGKIAEALGVEIGDLFKKN